MQCKLGGDDCSSVWGSRYAENQELVNKNSNVIKEQADVIAVLEERLRAQQGAPAGGRGLKSDKKQIKELEADVESLKVRLGFRVGLLVETVAGSTGENRDAHKELLQILPIHI